MTTLDLRAFIRDIPDFPRPGILFRDITLVELTFLHGRARLAPHDVYSLIDYSE